jgi:glutathione synthase/RimK-type ligase-like ATP-grasp enzyme
MEQSFPPALVEAINRREEDVRAEFLKTGGIRIDDVEPYTVIIDRISQDIPFYRALLKHAVLNGTRVINNPFWWTADDKFFNYALALKLGVTVPKTAILPSKEHPPGTTSNSMRNLIYPLNWDDLFAYVGFPCWMKPFDGGGWKHVYKLHSPEEFFNAYHQTGDLCMVLQEDIEFEEYYRCYVIGRKYVHIMPYEPRNPSHLRYQAGYTPTEDMKKRITDDCIKICEALGYDINTVEFAVRDGIPYAIDYMNPAPDAERDSVGEENFTWMVDTVATFAIEEARKGRATPGEYKWSTFLHGPSGLAQATAEKPVESKSAAATNGAPRQAPQPVEAAATAPEAAQQREASSSNQGAAASKAEAPKENGGAASAPATEMASSARTMPGANPPSESKPGGNAGASNTPAAPVKRDAGGKKKRK